MGGDASALYLMFRGLQQDFCSQHAYKGRRYQRSAQTLPVSTVDTWRVTDDDGMQHTRAPS